MKRSSLLLLIGAALFGVAAAIAASMFHDGLSSRDLAIPAGARSTQNPLPPSPEDLREARLHFADHCALCHGNDGSGDTLLGRGLYPKPPDLRLGETQSLTDGELFWIIENGVRYTGMPAFSPTEGAHGGEQDSWKLVHFLRHLPHLAAAERLEMERYNPKGPEDRAEEQQENDFLNEATPPAKPESHGHHRE